MLKCACCKGDFINADEAVHTHCHDDKMGEAEDRGFDRGNEEGIIEGRELEAREWAESARRRDVADLARAIAAGNKADAAMMLDRIAQHIPQWPETIATARAAVRG